MLPYQIATLLYCFNRRDDVLLLEREAQLACLGEYAAEAVSSRAAAQRHRDGSPREAGRRGYRRGPGGAGAGVGASGPPGAVVSR